MEPWKELYRWHTDGLFDVVQSVAEDDPHSTAAHDAKKRRTSRSNNVHHMHHAQSLLPIEREEHMPEALLTTEANSSHIKQKHALKPKDDLFLQSTMVSISGQDSVRNIVRFYTPTSALLKTLEWDVPSLDWPAWNVSDVLALFREKLCV